MKHHNKLSIFWASRLFLLARHYSFARRMQSTGVRNCKDGVFLYRLAV